MEIWSDIACPWCYVGKRRFETALERFEHRDEVEVVWRSFELDPDAPAERPEDGATHLSKKYGVPHEQAVAMNERMTQTAAGDGLEFNFDRLRLGNTFDAHRLVHLAKSLGRQHEMKERLMRAYLTEGELMSDVKTLERLALEVGLPEDEVRDVLATDRYADAVRADERDAQQLGIHAVPFFVVERAMGVSGAHEPDLLLKMLRKAWEDKNPAPLQVVADGATCGPDGC